MKKKLLKKSQLYLILDRDVLDYAGLLSVAKKAISAGVDIIQLRDKIGHNKNTLSLVIKLREVTRHKKTIFIMNDRLDLALLSDADGLHLGQDDIPIQQARNLLGKKKLIGISCHTLQQALTAESEGADYIGLGPIFATQTKPGFSALGIEIISAVKAKLKIPFFPIGGINSTNLQHILNAGASNIAVCRAICWQREAGKAAKILKKILLRNK